MISYKLSWTAKLTPKEAKALTKSKKYWENKMKRDLKKRFYR